MTTKTFSQSKMGRNPFAPKPIAATSPFQSEPRAKSYEQRDYETQKSDGVLLSLLALPLRGVVLGLKSLLVARYLFAHPREWRF